MKDKLYGLDKSFSYAMQGIAHILKTQRNARIIFLFGIAAVLSGIFLGISQAELLVVLVMVAVVFVAEVFNSMAEEILNIVSPEHDIRVKFVKDMAAGAVFIASIISLIIGSIIFLKHVF